MFGGALALLICAAMVLAACGGSKTARAPSVAHIAPIKRVSAGVGLFSPTSIWNAPLVSNAIPAASSAQLSTALADEVNREISWHTGPWINTNSWSVPFYTVGPDVRPIHVTLDNDSPTLQHDFDAVPIPPRAHPAAGADASLVIYQPSSNTLWEFWRARRDFLGGWHASWGGETADVSNGPGYYTGGFGGSGSGLSVAGGLIMIRELQAGEIDHALAISVPDTERGAFTWPADRSDGATSGPAAIPEGTRFRIDPNVDLSSLNLTPAGLVIARAVQRYGMIVRDTGHSVAFYAEDPTTGPGNPYGQLFGGQYPNQVLQNFPWDHLEVVAPGSNGSPG